MLINELLHDLSRRSSSAWAKNALASFRISFCPAQFLDLSLQGFDPISLLAGDAITHAGVDLVFANPFMQGFGARILFWAQSIQWRPIGRGIRHGAPAPCVLRVRVLRGKLCLICSWLHFLRGWSLLKTRGGSLVKKPECTCLTQLCADFSIDQAM